MGSIGIAQAAPLAFQKFDLKNTPFSEAQLQALTQLVAGEDVTDDALAGATENLKHLTIWKQLSVEARQTPDGVALYWTAEAFPLIREIHVSGNYPILEKRIRQLLGIRIGDAYNPDQIAEDRQRIKELYTKEGYFGTRIKADTQTDANGRLSITFRIARGRTFLWGPITCQGNRFFTCNRIANQIRDWFHFRPTQLNEGIIAIKDQYRKAGFPNIKVDVLRRNFDRRTKTASLLLSIDEGSRLTLDFKGNRFYGDKKLNAISQLLKRPGEGSRWQLKTATKRLLNAYYEKGFHNAAIESTQLQEDNQKTLTFTINEGRRTAIKKITFRGRKKLSAKDLKEAMILKESSLFSKSPFYRHLLPDDHARIEAAYKRAGFLEAQVGEPVLTYSRWKDVVTVTFPVEEGPRFELGQITFHGHTIFDDETLRKTSKLAPGKKATADLLTRAKETILLAYSKVGYPYAEIKIDEVMVSPLLHVTIQIEEGPRVTLDQILIQGNFRIKKSAILKALAVKPDAPLNLPQLIDGRLALRHFNAYQSIDLDVIGLKTQREHTTALLKVEEKPELKNEIRIGYDSDKSFSGKYSLIKRALFGTGQQLYLDLEGGFELSRASVTHLIPKVRGGDWNISETVFVQYDDDANFNALTSGGSLRGTRQLYPWLSLSVTPGIEFIDVRKIKTEALELERQKEDSTLATLGAAVSIDRRNNFSDPTKGFMTVTTVEYNQDIADAKSSFVESTFQFAVFQKLAWRFSLWNNTHLDRIFTISDSTQVPIQRLFFLGGNDTVRGFEEDSIDTAGGTFRFFNNTELHFALTPSIKLAGFLDTGALTDKLLNVDRAALRHSAGPGLRYFTPIGPLKFDYGFILDREDDEPRGRFHFSFGFFF